MNTKRKTDSANAILRRLTAIANVLSCPISPRSLQIPPLCRLTACWPSRHGSRLWVHVDMLLAVEQLAEISEPLAPIVFLRQLNHNLEFSLAETGKN